MGASTCRFINLKYGLGRWRVFWSRVFLLTRFIGFQFKRFSSLFSGLPNDHRSFTGVFLFLFTNQLICLSPLFSRSISFSPFPLEMACHAFLRDGREYFLNTSLSALAMSRAASLGSFFISFFQRSESSALCVLPLLGDDAKGNTDIPQGAMAMQLQSTPEPHTTEGGNTKEFFCVGL